jgi:Fe-S oxidoreductase
VVHIKQRIKGRKNYPTDEVDPKNFLSDKEVNELIKNKENYSFQQDDYYKLYNCVHCGECETENERMKLKEKFLHDGNTFEEYDEMVENFEKFRSPYPTNEMRIRKPEGIPKDSETLFFMGCLSTIRIPRYTEHALQYLLKRNIDFTILNKEICCGWHLLSSGLTNEFNVCKQENIEIFEKYQKIICLCPACYFLFNEYYKSEMKTKIQIDYISDYLKPSKGKKGSVGIQHLCQLKNRGREGVDKFVEKVLENSGYKVKQIPHWCCGGGTGWLNRTDVIESIARKRMEDFNNSRADYATTYCPSCWWILYHFGKKCKIGPEIRDLFELLL